MRPTGRENKMMMMMMMMMMMIKITVGSSSAISQNNESYGAYFAHAS